MGRIVTTWSLPPPVVYFLLLYKTAVTMRPFLIPRVSYIPCCTMLYHHVVLCSYQQVTFCRVPWLSQTLVPSYPTMVVPRDRLVTVNYLLPIPAATSNVKINVHVSGGVGGGIYSWSRLIPLRCVASHALASQAKATEDSEKPPVLDPSRPGKRKLGPAAGVLYGVV